MSKELKLKAWFPNTYVARMSYKAVDKYARAWVEHRPYFDTWKEAHDWMLAKADERLKRAHADLKKAANLHARVNAMSEPELTPIATTTKPEEA